MSEYGLTRGSIVRNTPYRHNRVNPDSNPQTADRIDVLEDNSVPYDLKTNIRAHITGHVLANSTSPNGQADGFGQYFHSNEQRIAVYSQDWDSSDRGSGYAQWYAHDGNISGGRNQNEKRTEVNRKLVGAYHQGTSGIMLTRRYLLESQGKQPIPAYRYVLSQSQLMQGNYKASNP